VLDGHFDLSHPDINFNLASARSFVAGEPAITPGPGVGSAISHGTQMAGIIAATADGVGTVGVAPDAEIIPIKVFSDAGLLDFAGLIAALYYAAAIDADVINMSFNAVLPRAGFCLPDGSLDAEQIDALARIFQRAIGFARDNGATPVAAAGNLGLELDPDGPLVSFPAMAQGVIAVGAVGPTGWALDPSTDLDVPLAYSNFGAEYLDLTAPGGMIGYPDGTACDFGFGAYPCSWFDKILTTDYPHPYYFGGGTSHATAFVSGVAALVAAKFGGHVDAKRAWRVLRKSADDLGPPGRDAHFGYGRVNAAHAVQ
jgi:subtilisin family serine protease